MIFKRVKEHSKGFTLIELLIVIAVMAILTTVVFVALNPLARFQDARNNRRWTDVNAILSAVKLNQVDNEGVYLSTIVNDTNDDEGFHIGTAGEECGETDVTCSNPSITLNDECVDLSLLVTDGYLPSIPLDPGPPTGVTADAERTGYYLIKKSNGSITIGSCYEEQGSNTSVPQISVTR